MRPWQLKQSLPSVVWDPQILGDDPGAALRTLEVPFKGRLEVIDADLSTILGVTPPMVSFSAKRQGHPIGVEPIELPSSTDAWLEGRLLIYNALCALRYQIRSASTTFGLAMPRSQPLDFRWSA